MVAPRRSPGILYCIDVATLPVGALCLSGRVCPWWVLGPACADVVSVVRRVGADQLVNDNSVRRWRVVVIAVLIIDVVRLPGAGRPPGPLWGMLGFVVVVARAVAIGSVRGVSWHHNHATAAATATTAATVAAREALCMFPRSRCVKVDAGHVELPERDALLDVEKILRQLAESLFIEAVDIASAHHVALHKDATYQWIPHKRSQAHRAVC